MLFPRLLQDYLLKTTERFPEKIALIAGGNEISFAELQKRSDLLSKELADLGLKRGDRVIIFLDNSIEAVISLYGVVKAGAVFVILNSSMKPWNMSYIIEDSGAAIIITHTNKAKIISESLSDIRRPVKSIWIGDEQKIPAACLAMSAPTNSLNLDRACNEEDTGPRVCSTIDLDLAALIYTSGSTGRSKGVMCTHRSMVSAAQNIIQYLDNRSDDIIIDVLPLSFDYGLYQVIMGIMFGGTVVLERNFFFVHQILKNIEKYRVTGFPVVPTILAMILDIEDLSMYDFSSLRYITNTGAALSVERIKSFRKKMPHIRIYSMFGLTECKRIAYLPTEEIDNRPESVGKAIPNCEVFIADQNGDLVDRECTGELVVRGSNLMSGYWNSPELTATTFRKGRFPGEKLLYTGDFFKIDQEGFLYFVGRKDDMIKYKGERVSPREIEEVISEIGSISEVAVAGIEDSVAGQTINAFVSPVKGKAISEREVQRYCAQRLENFKIPNTVRILETLPKTANGKIDKKALKNA